jgi:hypothetical protein
MGPLLPVRETADGLEWAHCFQLEKLLDGLEWAHCCCPIVPVKKLLMALNGPISASQRNC